MGEPFMLVKSTGSVKIENYHASYPVYVIFDGTDRLVINRYPSLVFAASAMKNSDLKINVVDPKLHKLGNANSGGIKYFEHGAVSAALSSVWSGAERSISISFWAELGSLLIGL